MKGFLKEAVLAAALATTTQANGAMSSDLSHAADTRVEHVEMGFSAGVPSASFSLVHDGQVQEMYQPPEGRYSGVFYKQIAISCEDLTTDFAKSVDFIEDRLRPTGIEIDRAAVRPSVEAAVKEAAMKCSPAMM